MNREFWLASVLTAVWSCLCFLLLGVGFEVAENVVGSRRLERFEMSLGELQLWGGADIPWAVLLIVGLTMLMAAVPVNYYWIRRLNSDKSP